MRGHMTEKIDVFAFGVVALEIVAGESNHHTTIEEETTYIFEKVRSIKATVHSKVQPQLCFGRCVVGKIYS